MTSFSNLPKELLKRILSLTQSYDPAGVCKLWRDITNESDILAKIVLDANRGSLRQAIMLAFRNDQCEVARALCSISTSANNRFSALQEVCGRGEKGMAQTLLSLLNGDATHANLSDSLWAAAGTGDCDIMSLLLEHGALPDFDALYAGVLSGSLDAVHLLLFYPDNPAHADGSNGDALVTAAYSGYTEIVGLLLDCPYPARADSQQGEALIRAAAGGYVDIVKMLMSAKVNPARADSKWSEALKIAVESNNCEIAEALLSAAENPANPRHFINQAVINDNMQMLNLLLESGASVRDGLISAAQHGSAVALKRLLDNPQPAWMDTENMADALVESALNGTVEVARMLLDAPGEKQWNADLVHVALMEAIIHGQQEIATLIIGSKRFVMKKTRAHRQKIEAAAAVAKKQRCMVVFEELRAKLDHTELD